MSSEPYLFALFPSVDINYAASFISNAESVSERSGYLSDIRNSLIAIPGRAVDTGKSHQRFL